MGEAALAELNVGQVMCTKYPDRPAVALFAWPWDEKGACSAQYQAELRITARNLKRECMFSPLPAPASKMTRDERVQMHAERLALEEELKASKTHGLTLYNDNKGLADEVRRLRARGAALEAAHGELQRSHDDVSKERDELLVQAGEAVEEVTRLHALLGRELELQSEVDELKAQLEKKS